MYTYMEVRCTRIRRLDVHVYGRLDVHVYGRLDVHVYGRLDVHVYGKVRCTRIWTYMGG